MKLTKRGELAADLAYAALFLLGIFAMSLIEVAQ